MTDIILFSVMINMTHPSSLFLFQALDSLQRAQELADGIGNKVAVVSDPGKHTSRTAVISPFIDKFIE